MNWPTKWSRHPIKPVAVAGGWRGFDTMLKCTTSPMMPYLLAMTSELRKRHDPAVATTKAGCETDMIDCATRLRDSAKHKEPDDG
jgi:hypothetical protein